MAVALLSSASAQTSSGEINAGIEAYKSAMYERAIVHFRKAVDLDPKLVVARLYLATCYAQM